MNRQAFARLTSPKEMKIIPGAGHLFEEPGALEEVARLAREWFLRYLVPGLDPFEPSVSATRVSPRPTSTGSA